jgi:hypothetical protein
MSDTNRPFVFDFFSEIRPETLMLYIGFGGTITPAHKDVCGALGHNVMIYADNNGSALWFIANPNDKHAVRYCNFPYGSNSSNCVLKC